MQGVHSFRALKNIDTYKALCHLLDWSLRQQLDSELPTHYELCRRVAKSPSVMTVITHLYWRFVCRRCLGNRQHLALQKGRVPFVLELLSPAQRPLQITRDLANFWQGAYRDVQKEIGDNSAVAPKLFGEKRMAGNDANPIGRKATAVVVFQDEDDYDNYDDDDYYDDEEPMPSRKVKRKTRQSKMRWLLWLLVKIFIIGAVLLALYGFYLSTKKFVAVLMAKCGNYRLLFMGVW
ncbi:unnamed protein product [Ranitomeya imitator]|uniref:Uncharacterized protein n=1 Tax=Ranitomeya imitator TaxID=111125 RepID=A0ABN9M2B9_9NEOB|nr:unnamed protein product [Ranitomeya imitator]